MNTQKERDLKLVQELKNRFGAIPARKWCVGEFISDGNRRCALGHLGMKKDSNLRALPYRADRLFERRLGKDIPHVNDFGLSGDGFIFSKTPRANILRALDKIEEGLLK